MAKSPRGKGTKAPAALPGDHVTPIGDVPICRDCRHSQCADDDFYRCWHPLTQQLDIVSGPRPVYCTTARAHEPCGYEGNLFEAKRSLWVRLRYSREGPGADKHMAKTPARKRKPTLKRPSRTIIAKTMTPQPEALDSLVDIGPITLKGTFDDGALAAFQQKWTEANGAPRELTISASRRFLWWEVHRQRIQQTVRIQAHTVTQEPDGAITYSVPMKVDGPCETILSPWWERTLYAIARIWS